MKKRLVIMAVVLTVIFGGAIGFKLLKREMIRDYLANMGTPTVPLNAARVTPATWEERLPAIGSLRARQGIEIRSEASGVIDGVHVESGQQVKAGDLIVTMDDEVEQATLKSAKVRLAKARRDFKRDQSLYERELLSEGEFENSRSEVESAEAMAEETQGIIFRKSIRAPFDGTVGIHSLAEGHYLAPGDEVVTLQALNTLYLDMMLPEKELERLSVGQQVSFTVPSRGDTQFKGEVRFIDARIQSSSRNILVRAEVDNAEGYLLPGMFADATIHLGQVKEVLTVPREAVAYSLYGETIYVLEQKTEAADKKDQEGGEQQGEEQDSQPKWFATRRQVSTGEVRGEVVALEGVQAGDLVARDTQNRLLGGTPVSIENLESLSGTASSGTASPTSAEPAPAESTTTEPTAEAEAPAATRSETAESP